MLLSIDGGAQTDCDRGVIKMMMDYAGYASSSSSITLKDCKK